MQQHYENPAIIWQHRLEMLQKVSDLNYRELAQELGCSRGQLYKIREAKVKRPNLVFRKGLELLEQKYEIHTPNREDKSNSHHLSKTQQELLSAYERLSEADKLKYLSLIQRDALKQST